MNNLINCLFYEEELLNKLSQKIAELKRLHGIIPSLATILVGDHTPSEIYVKNKTKKAKRLGINVINHQLGNNISETKLLNLIEELNNNKAINAILLQLPLPPNLNKQKIISAINPLKDVDGLHPLNAGHLLTKNYYGLIPCTPLAVCYVLKRETTLKGRNVVIVGRSNLVGLPAALLLLHEDATVTICHIHTQNLANICKKADILVVAIGNAQFITKDYIKEGAIVIDVGINRVATTNNNAANLKLPTTFINNDIIGCQVGGAIKNNKKSAATTLEYLNNNTNAINLVNSITINQSKKSSVKESLNYIIVGDVKTSDALAKNARITPVPKGIGRLTTTFLLYNTYKAALRQYNLADDSYDIFF